MTNVRWEEALALARTLYGSEYAWIHTDYSMHNWVYYKLTADGYVWNGKEWHKPETEVTP